MFFCNEVTARLKSYTVEIFLTLRNYFKAYMFHIYYSRRFSGGSFSSISKSTSFSLGALICIVLIARQKNRTLLGYLWETIYRHTCFTYLPRRSALRAHYLYSFSVWLYMRRQMNGGESGGRKRLAKHRLLMRNIKIQTEQVKWALARYAAQLLKHTHRTVWPHGLAGWLAGWLCGCMWLSGCMSQWLCGLLFGWRSAWLCR